MTENSVSAKQFGLLTVVLIFVASATVAAQTSIQRQSFDAVNSGSESAVVETLAHGASLRARDAHGRTPIALAYQRIRTNNGDRVLAALLQEAARRAKREHRHRIEDVGCTIIGPSLICWAGGESGLQVFGRSGGLLLDAQGWYPTPVEAKDVDHDGRIDLSFTITTGRGTGTLTKYRYIYSFDGQRFLDPLLVTNYSYVDTTWFGRITDRGNKSIVPMMTTVGEIKLTDSNHDGVDDTAEAVERRWWGDRLSDDDRAKPLLEEGPGWVSRILQQRYGLALGEIQTRVVARWVRNSSSPAGGWRLHK